MGNRLRVAKVYKIEYADKEEFNWMVSEVKDMFNALGIECCDMNHAYTDGYGEMFEVDKEQFLEGIITLEDFEDEDIPSEITEVMERCNLTKDELCSHLREYYNLADTRKGYILFNFI